MATVPQVIGNWKMHGTRDRAVRLAEAVLAGTGSLHDRCAVAVCPPFVYLEAVVHTVAGRALEVGGQDTSASEPGAHTGDVAAAMLADVGCSLCIVGHSERRAAHAESDALVASKFAAAVRYGLRPVLCVGETLQQREQGDNIHVVRRQLEAVLEHVGSEGFAGAVVAYEPIWAIGTGVTATPEQAQEMHAAIRAVVAERDAALAADLPLLYGGSVKPANAAELFAMPDVNGGLIGGASLVAEDFLAICAAAANRAAAHNED